MPSVTPYKDSPSGKKAQVAEMFDNIASSYDFLNHFLSCGIDILWRRKAIRLLKGQRPQSVLDIATGTGDFAIEALKLQPGKIVGMDISEKMLEAGRKKLIRKKMADKIELKQGDSENLPFDDAGFDAITTGFGVRNFENLEKGLSEMHRVLKINGTVVILEFSKPERFPVKQFYFFYFTKILPLIGKLFSKDNNAYTYLPQSVNVFPCGEDFLNIMKQAGFRECYQKKLTFGIASLYVGKKCE